MSEQRIPAAFILTADDPIAPKMVMMWACFKNGDIIGAINEFNAIAQDFGEKYMENPAHDDVVQAAVAVAEEMEGDDDDG